MRWFSQGNRSLSHQVRSIPVKMSRPIENNYWMNIQYYNVVIVVADGGGGGGGAGAPSDILIDYVKKKIPFWFCIRMPINEAQIARESIYNPRTRLLGALDPGRIFKGLPDLRSRCACAHSIIFRAPLPLNEIPGSALRCQTSMFIIFPKLETCFNTHYQNALKKNKGVLTP